MDHPSVPNHRQYWVNLASKLAAPVLATASKGHLRELMPIETAGGASREDRAQYTHLEALGRLLCGLAPWLELESKAPESGTESERHSRAAFAAQAREAIALATDPASPAFLNFERGGQPLVDAAFLAQALLRAPQTLWEPLDATAKANVVSALRRSGVITPGFNNWLLFAAEVEAFFASIGEAYDSMRIDYAVRQHEQWYFGGGFYGDGPHYRSDYYNAFVIQPMLIDVLEAVRPVQSTWQAFLEPVWKRAQAYAVWQEQIIAPDGSFPATGRSIAYRAGAFQVLSLTAWRRQLPESLPPARVRCALNAVLQRTLEAPNTFDDGGWLRIGLAGHQTALGEGYISTGSLYLTAAAFLPLGLPAEDEFWTAPDEPWTSQLIWGGENVKRPTGPGGVDAKVGI